MAMRVISESTADGIKTVGEWITLIGIGSMFIMTFVAFGMFELILICILLKESSRSNSEHSNQFMLGYLLGSHFNLSYHHHNRSYRTDLDDSIMTLIITSLIITMLTLTLAFTYGQPFIGMMLIIGWATAFTLTGIGLGIESLGDMLKGHSDDVLSSESGVDPNLPVAIPVAIPCC